MAGVPKDTPKSRCLTWLRDNNLCIYIYRMSVRTQIIPDNDDFQTPKEAWELIEKYIDLKDKVIWCPFWMEGEITWDHKQLIHKNEDFFQAPIPLLHDCIVDNPPYSIKEKVLNRCMELGDPFALLLPIDTLERKYFRKMLADWKPSFTIIIPRERYNFNGGNNKKNCSFKSCWFCFGFDELKEGMIFN